MAVEKESCLDAPAAIVCEERLVSISAERDMIPVSCAETDEADRAGVTRSGQEIVRCGLICDETVPGSTEAERGRSN